ncbi:hypothetical protein GUJ93_ZPchr0458g22502 [Zizania palustris]|uniref:Uncharacterized protein n=1 Tax=Zizania palustris TaxID=103762 RepID=A0A8J5R028_ZIZPA|nr:hypothetical protein GUJ93_ZPchr0458g22502 [Zizania palustris]
MVVVEEEDNQSEEEEIVTEQFVDEEDDDGLLLFPAHLSHSLRELFIVDCPELILALVTEHEEETGRHGLQALRSLESLEIRWCSKFLSAYKSSSSFGFPPFLEDLDMYDEDGIFEMHSRTELFIKGGDSTCEALWPLLTQDQLSSLKVKKSNFFCRLGGLQEEQLLLLKRSFKPWKLDTDDMSGFLVKPICSLLSSSLTRLQFGGNDEVEHFTEEQEEALQLLTSLQDLQFYTCKKLQCLPMGLHRLTNFKKLKIKDCPSIRIRSLPLLSSLEQLKVKDCKKLQRHLTQLHTLTNLKKLKICDCSSIRSLPLPSSLEQLKVKDCKKLRYLFAELHTLTNLKTLEIVNCPSIRSLPKGGLPSSLEELDVSDCGNKKLKQRCSKLMGTIPNIIL